MGYEAVQPLLACPFEVPVGFGTPQDAESLRGGLLRSQGWRALGGGVH